MSIKDHIWIFVVLGISIAFYRLYKARIKGAIGETFIAYRLAQLPKAKYKVINNLVLKNGDKTSQIDHLIVSNYGVFVIETKNLKGWIFGSEYATHWTQVIYKRRERFYNPIRQNLGHIKALKQTLDLFPGTPFIPIVVFSNGADLKVDVTSDVVYSGELLKMIRSYTDIKLSETEKTDIFDAISSANISRKYNRKAHINAIRQRINERENLIDHDICPICRGNLIVRNGNFGTFRGCSNFPRCRFTVESTY